MKQFGRVHSKRRRQTLREMPAPENLMAIVEVTIGDCRWPKCYRVLAREAEQIAATVGGVAKAQAFLRRYAGLPQRIARIAA